MLSTAVLKILGVLLIMFSTTLLPPLIIALIGELERTHLYRKLKGLGINPKAEKYRE